MAFMVCAIGNSIFHFMDVGVSFVKNYANKTFF